MALESMKINIFDRIKSNKTLSANIVGVILLKGVALVLAFVMTPMYLSYFNDQSILGVWYTLQSILIWILTFDLGVGNGLRNRLASSMAINDVVGSKRVVTSCYFITGIVTLVIVGMLFCVVPFVNWQKRLNTDVQQLTLSLVLLVTLVGIALQFFFKIVTSILMALRKNVLANSLPIVTNLIILLFLIVPYRSDDDHKFVTLAFVYSAATVLPLILITIFLFAGPLKHIRPSIKCFDKQIARDVMGVGGVFFVIQICLLVINSTNHVLINSFFGGEDVVQYTLYYRLYGMATMVFTLFTQPVWSEISFHYALNEIDWIRKVYYFMIFVAFIIGLGCVAVTWALPFIFRVWIGNASGICGDRSIGTLFVLWAIVELCVAAGTCVANGMTHLKCQFFFTVLAAIAKFPVTVLLVKMCPAWTGVIVAHTIVLLPLMLGQNIVLLRTFYVARQKERINMISS